MTVTRCLAAILAADCDEISETGLLVALSRRSEMSAATAGDRGIADLERTSPNRQLTPQQT